MPDLIVEQIRLHDEVPPSLWKSSREAVHSDSEKKKWEGAKRDAKVANSEKRSKRSTKGREKTRPEKTTNTHT